MQYLLLGALSTEESAKQERKAWEVVQWKGCACAKSRDAADTGRLQHTKHSIQAHSGEESYLDQQSS